MTSIREYISTTRPDLNIKIGRVFCSNCGKDITEESKYSKLGHNKLYCRKCFYEKEF